MRGDGAFNRCFITTVIFPVPNDVGSSFHRVWIFREHFSVILSKITIAFHAKDRDFETLLRLCALKKKVNLEKNKNSIPQFEIRGYYSSYAEMLDSQQRGIGGDLGGFFG